MRKEIILTKIMVTCLWFFIGCNSNVNEDYWQNVSFVGENHSVVYDLIFDTIFFDNLQLSHIGELTINRDTFFFFDHFLGNLNLFSIDGHHIGTHLGFGSGPNEIFNARNFVSTEDGYIVLGSMIDYYALSPAFEIKKRSLINWGGNNSPEMVYYETKPDMVEIYELLKPQNLPKIFKNKYLLMPVHTEHYKYNGFISSDYYRDSRIFAILNIETEQIERVEGRRSPEYLKYRYLPNFDFFNFDLLGNEIVVSYNIDSCLYILNSAFIPIAKFGFAGKNMNTDYRQTIGYDDAIDNFLFDRYEFGYYNFVTVVEETGLIFRTYTRGGNLPNGLQVYNKEFNLIADVNVPPGFRIIGNKGNVYFAECTNGIESNPMYVLKFDFN